MTSDAPNALSRSAFSAVDVVAITRAPKIRANCKANTDTPPEPWVRTVSPGGNSTIAGHSYPGGHRGTWQGRGLLEGEVARHVHERFLVQHRVLSQHAVEIGTQPIRKVIRLDRAAIPARMKAAGNPVTDLDPRHP